MNPIINKLYLVLTTFPINKFLLGRLLCMFTDESSFAVLKDSAQEEIIDSLLVHSRNDIYVCNNHWLYRKIEVVENEKECVRYTFLPTWGLKSNYFGELLNYKLQHCKLDMKENLVTLRSNYNDK